MTWSWGSEPMTGYERISKKLDAAQIELRRVIDEDRSFRKRAVFFPSIGLIGGLLIIALVLFLGDK
jgi:hypothetical protein